MSAVIEGLLTDLRSEQDELFDLLRSAPASTWKRQTPAPHWNVQDQVAHVAHFDWIATVAFADPDEFIRMRESLGDLQTYVDAIGPANAHRSGEQMLQWWDEERNALLEAAARLAALDASARVPWFGPSMSIASKITARLMETWAHGQDITDAIGLRRAPTARLRHIARIGVLAFANSFRSHGRQVPDDTVYVDLQGVDGDRWTWGEPSAANSVRGPAEDFCLVVTQRRHIADTTLDVSGEIATEWMTVAQAFAGPPGKGRQPGQFEASAQTLIV